MKFCGFKKRIFLIILVEVALTCAVMAAKNLNESAIAEKIVALKRSKAGHLGQLTKIYRHLDEYLNDYKFVNEVRVNKERLTTQWCRYASVHQEICELLHVESEELSIEKDCHINATKDYELYMSLIPYST